MSDDLSPEETERRREAALKKAPPHKAQPKASPRPPATKAEHASFKRSNKMAFKPAPKKS